MHACILIGKNGIDTGCLCNFQIIIIIIITTTTTTMEHICFVLFFILIFFIKREYLIFFFQVEVTDAALLCLIEKYCHEAGVQNLQKHIEKIYHKVC